MEKGKEQAELVWNVDGFCCGDVAGDYARHFGVRSESTDRNSGYIHTKAIIDRNRNRKRQ